MLPVVPLSRRPVIMFHNYNSSSLILDINNGEMFISHVIRKASVRH